MLVNKESELEITISIFIQYKIQKTIFNAHRKKKIIYKKQNV